MNRAITPAAEHHVRGPEPREARRTAHRREPAGGIKTGTNIVTVVARENEDTATRYTMVVRRDSGNGEALPTPKSDEFGADWEFVGDDE